MAAKNQKLKQRPRRKKGVSRASHPSGSSFGHEALQQALALHRTGRLREAEALYNRVLRANPDQPDALHHLGLLAWQSGQSRIGEKLIRQALHRRPEYVQAHFDLGKVLFAQHRLEEAAACFRRVIAFKPDYAEAHNNLGVALHDLGRLHEAAAAYRRALALQPDLVHLHSNLGITLKDLGALDEAAACYRRVLGKKPGYAEAHYNLGVILQDQGSLDEAASCYRRALDLQPNLAEAHNNLGIINREQGRLEEAVACYRRALSLTPDYTEAHSNLLMCMNYLPGLSAADYLDEARRFGERSAALGVRPYTEWTCAARPQQLRIGMVSGDFRNHPVGYFLENLLAAIDPAHMAMIAYPTTPREDALTARIRPRFAAWKPLWGLSDEDAARMIHDDGVHILLDLAGHTRHNRLPVFAWRPAPVQVSWLGYFASTGMAAMDYLLADPISVPESYQSCYMEKVWHLPTTRLCFTPPAVKGPVSVTPLPALRNGHVTFGCFQGLAKINDGVLAVWGRILQAMPTARLRLQNRQLNSERMRAHLLHRLSRYGIAPEQVLLEQSVPREQYLAAHAHIDIILDTFPFNGGTTTCEGLWMGVPTVTLTGRAMVARQGASLLNCAGLTDWIAVNDEDYAAKALAHAADLAKLARLRHALREQLLASPLCDGPGFARNFEAALWGMWRSCTEKR